MDVLVALVILDKLDSKTLGIIREHCRTRWKDVLIDNPDEALKLGKVYANWFFGNMRNVKDIGVKADGSGNIIVTAYVENNLETYRVKFSEMAHKDYIGRKVSAKLYAVIAEIQNSDVVKDIGLTTYELLPIVKKLIQLLESSKNVDEIS